MTTLTIERAQKNDCDDFRIVQRQGQRSLQSCGFKGVLLTETKALYVIFKIIALIWGNIECFDTEHGKQYFWIRGKSAELQKGSPFGFLARDFFSGHLKPTNPLNG